MNTDNGVRAVQAALDGSCSTGEVLTDIAPNGIVSCLPLSPDFVGEIHELNAVDHHRRR